MDTGELVERCVGLVRKQGKDMAFEESVENVRKNVVKMTEQVATSSEK